MIEAVRPSEDERYLPFAFPPGFTMPTLNQNQARLRTLECDFGPFLDVLNEGEPSNLHQLLELEGADAVARIEELVLAYGDAQLETLGLDEDFAIRARTGFRDRTWAGVDNGSADQFVMLELNAKLNRLRCRLTIHWAQEAAETGLDEVTQLETYHLMPVLSTTDQRFLRVRFDKSLVSNEIREAQVPPLVNEGAVARRDSSGEYKEIKLCDEYPQETAVIISCLEQLIEDLGTLLDGPSADLARVKIAYYQALTEAYRESTNEAWLKVDKLLASQIAEFPEASLFTHPIETVYNPLGIRDPEASFLIADTSPEAAEMQTVFDEVKKVMQESFGSVHFADWGAIQSTLELLDKSGVVMRVVMGSSGRRLFKRNAGQNIPNKVEARAEGGVVAFSMIKGIEARLSKRAQLIEKAFGSSRLASLLLERNTLLNFAKDVAEHELGHTLAMVLGIEERLKENTLQCPFAEEWKATVGGMIGNLYVPYLDDPSQENMQGLKNWFLDRINVALFTLGLYLDHPDAHGYVRKSMMIMRPAEEAGVLFKNSQGTWDVDLDDEKMRAFLAALFESYRRLIEIYENGSANDLKDHLRPLLQPGEFSEDIGQILHEQPFGKRLVDFWQAGFGARIGKIAGLFSKRAAMRSRLNDICRVPNNSIADVVGATRTNADGVIAA